MFISQIEKSESGIESLTAFTSQNKSGNPNWNREAYTNLRIIPIDYVPKGGWESNSDSQNYPFYSY